MQKSTQFTVIIQGATLESDLHLNIPSEDYSFWLFKESRAILHFCSTIEHSRNFFAKTFKGHSTIFKKGFTVQSSKCGPKAENYIRKILKEDGW